MLLRDKSLGQSRFSHFAVADEHQPQLVRAHVRASSQKLKNPWPSAGHNFGGRLGKPFALPRVVPNTDRGLEAEFQLHKLGVAQDAGDQVASDRNRDVVAFLQRQSENEI